MRKSVKKNLSSKLFAHTAMSTGQKKLIAHSINSECVDAYKREKKLATPSSSLFAPALELCCLLAIPEQGILILIHL
jgi:hypothetical protein